MLARTADTLFWLARQMERADFTAGMIEATLRLEYLPRSGVEDPAVEWEGALNAVGAYDAYIVGRERIDEASAIDFLTFDRVNPSSICNCLENARANGRAVRTALTVETWTAINDAWLELKRFEAKRRPGKDLDREALNRLGVFLERADNTARLLDVKYHLLLPSNEEVGGSLDYFQWVAILRAVSAATAYHWVYRDRVKPWLIADLLILKPAMPRSLIACYVGIDSSLDSLAREDGRSGLEQRNTRPTLAALERAGMDDIFQSGLHEFITDFIEDNARLADTISEQYLFV